MEKHLYNYNETMRILGKQEPIFAGTPTANQITDVIQAYYAMETMSSFTLFYEIILLGAGRSFLTDIFNLGVIHGKQMERKNKKHNKKHNRSKVCSQLIGEMLDQGDFESVKAIHCYIELMVESYQNNYNGFDVLEEVNRNED